MLFYAAKFNATKEGVLVRFRDVPEAITDGTTQREAHEMATSALLTATDFYLEAWSDDSLSTIRLFQMPSPRKPGERMIALPTSRVIKLMLSNTMIQTHTTRATLASLMRALTPKVNAATMNKEVSELLDPKCFPRFELFDQAFTAMGKHLHLSVH